VCVCVMCTGSRKRKVGYGKLIHWKTQNSHGDFRTYERSVTYTRIFFVDDSVERNVFPSRSGRSREIQKPSPNNLLLLMILCKEKRCDVVYTDYFMLLGH
jgi:hypothetical protein